MKKQNWFKKLGQEDPLTNAKLRLKVCSDCDLEFQMEEMSYFEAVQGDICQSLVGLIGIEQHKNIMKKVREYILQQKDKINFSHNKFRFRFDTQDEIHVKINIPLIQAACFDGLRDQIYQKTLLMIPNEVRMEFIQNYQIMTKSPNFMSNYYQKCQKNREREMIQHYQEKEERKKRLQEERQGRMSQN